MLKAVQDWDYAEVKEEQAFIVHQGTKGRYGCPHIFFLSALGVGMTVCGHPYRPFVP